LNAPDIPPESLAAGIVLAQHYVTEWLRLHEAAFTRPEVLRAEQLRNWLLQRDEEVIALLDVYQRGPNGLREAKSARQAIEILEEHGWVVRIEGGALVQGTFRQDVWKVVRA